MAEANGQVLKGLIWCCSVADDPSMTGCLAESVERYFAKIPGIGVHSQAAGNACIAVLGALSGMEPIRQLSRLRMRIKNRPGLELIDKSLQAAAERAGMPAADLEEVVVPTFGLDCDGRLREEIGSCAVEIAVNGARLAAPQWFGPDCKPRKSVPAEVTKDFAAELKSIKATIAEISKMLPAHRSRIERFLLAERSWPLAEWRQRYLDHPLIGGMCRRLIWRFADGERSVLGIWDAGRIVDAEGRPIDWLEDRERSVTVRIWHPIESPAEEALRWRVRIENTGVVQPFKQAHREIYLLTPAECDTATYSNRFAEHVVKQHQFRALCAERGWQYSLRGAFDSLVEPVATVRLPEWSLKAEFWVDEPHDGGDTTELGIFLYVATDQVRFYGQGSDPLPLTEIPPLVFSEVMRDVDLFVGVSSIGSDPEWHARAPQQLYEDYWREYSFGELQESALARKELLGRLVPKLKIADRCSIEDRYLSVRGQLHTYRIHLGSGNVLMSPNDRYLCIVAGQSGPAEAGREGLFLPFEGDRTLSLILSKAFLLADDAKIDDPTILQQIR